MKICFDLRDDFLYYWLNNRSIFYDFDLRKYLMSDDIDELIEKGSQHFTRNSNNRNAQQVIENTINGEAIHYYLSRKYPDIWIPAYNQENKYEDLIWDRRSIEIKTYAENFIDSSLTTKSFKNICKNIKIVPEYSRASYVMLFSRVLSYGSNPIVHVKNPEDITYLLCFIYNYNTKKPVFYNEDKLRSIGVYNFFLDKFGDIDV